MGAEQSTATSGSATIEGISNISLMKLPDGNEDFLASSLWEGKKCAVIQIVRRPGCPLCRHAFRWFSPFICTKLINCGL